MKFIYKRDLYKVKNYLNSEVYYKFAKMSLITNFIYDPRKLLKSFAPLIYTNIYLKLIRLLINEF